MIDGLRREFPQAFELARRVPNPRFAAASPLWAVLAGFGAAFFVSSALYVVLSMTARLFGAPLVWVGGVATVSATATALSVAHTVGGRGAVIVYAGIVIVERLLGLPGLMRFCLAIVSDAPICSPFSYVLSLWPEAVGLALAYWLVRVRWMRATEWESKSAPRSGGGTCPHAGTRCGDPFSAPTFGWGVRSGAAPPVLGGGGRGRVRTRAAQKGR